MNHKYRLNQYRIMWLYVFFDLPTETPQQRKVASKFRKSLLNDGFKMFQFSIYLRHCTSRENATVHERRVKKLLPRKGKICILTITDKQFGMMTVYHGTRPISTPSPHTQLEMF